MSKPQSEELLKADPAARRKIIIILIMVTIAGILILSRIFPLLFDYLAALPRTKSIQILTGLLSFLSIIPLGIGFSMMRQGIRIVQAECIPPPGTNVWRDTQIIRGAEAKKRGVIIIFLSSIILVFAIFLAVIPYYLGKSVSNQISGQSEFK